jgi:hypothetical protein
MATTISTHTSTFSFTAPFPSPSGPKHRRVSLATPASEREVPAFKFRDDTGLPLPSPSDERRGKLRRLGSPAPPEKKARKKWTMEETQMLVEGCNRVGLLFRSLSASPSHLCALACATLARRGQLESNSERSYFTFRQPFSCGS